MLPIYRGIPLLLLLFTAQQIFSQATVKGKVIDVITKEPVAGATIHCTEAGCDCGCTTDASGSFTMNCRNCQKLSISSIGYTAQQFSLPVNDIMISLSPTRSLLQEVVVSTNRGEAVTRALAPVAISVVSSKTIQDTKPATIDQVLNKVSGVLMVNLGNEQHEMSIRQPMTTKSLFLYLEDGIPIRTTGLFNHNALLEINMPVVKSIEVIKGPSSSLYGSEAIGGVVNFISLSPTAIPVVKLSAQGSTIGYRRTDLVSSFTKGKWGFVVGGYYASKHNSYLEYSDFHKAALTLRADYHFSDKTTVSSSITRLSYYSDMPGGIDSAMFASHSFRNPQSFTYRKVEALRYRSTLSQLWNDRSKTGFSLLYRNNTIGQNPAYRIKDDYHRQGTVYVGNKSLAHGEINSSSFNSYGLLAQHRQDFGWKKAAFTAGLSAELNPSAYNANYIRINKDTVSKKYTGYQNTDSVLTDYSTRLNNYAAFTNLEFSPFEKMRVVASLRYDFFRYGFANRLAPSAFSGSRDTINYFHRVSPKIGATYNFNSHAGIYANYSEGFVPPQVSDLYTGVKVPALAPSIFYNYEAGGWVSLIREKLTADISFYRLDGTNEIITVKSDDGSYANANAGKTRHRGIELGVNAVPLSTVSFRLSGAFSRHEFMEYIEKGSSYNGLEMNNAPRWIYNAEAWYRPAFAKGLRLGAEWQHTGSYFADPKNTARAAGYDVVNLRAGYRFKAIELWANLLNAMDSYYSYITTKSAYGYSYQLAEPRNINMGASFDLATLFKK